MNSHIELRKGQVSTSAMTKCRQLFHQIKTPKWWYMAVQSAWHRPYTKSSVALSAHLPSLTSDTLKTLRMCWHTSRHILDAMLGYRSPSASCHHLIYHPSFRDKMEIMPKCVSISGSINSRILFALTLTQC